SNSRQIFRYVGGKAIREHQEKIKRFTVGAVYDRAFFPARNEKRAVIDRAYSQSALLAIGVSRPVRRNPATTDIACVVAQTVTKVPGRGGIVRDRFIRIPRYSVTRQ